MKIKLLLIGILILGLSISFVNAENLTGNFTGTYPSGEVFGNVTLNDENNTQLKAYDINRINMNSGDGVLNVSKNSSKVQNIVKNLIVKYYRENSSVLQNQSLQRAIWHFTNNYSVDSYLEAREMVNYFLNETNILQINDSYTLIDVEGNLVYEFTFYYAFRNTSTPAKIAPMALPPGMQEFVLFEYIVSPLKNGTDDEGNGTDNNNGTEPPAPPSDTNSTNGTEEPIIDSNDPENPSIDSETPSNDPGTPPSESGPNIDKMAKTNPTSIVGQAAMKNTAIPLQILIIALVSIVGLAIKRKKN